MNQLARNPRIDTIRTALGQMKAQIAAAAPRHLTPDRISRIFMTSIQAKPELAGCTMESLFGCLLTCTQVGLEPDSASQKAHLIPYKNKCTLIFGYQGLMELARRSPDVLDILPPQVVRQNDEFAYELGTSPALKHRPADGDRGEITHFYAVAVLKSGERPFVVMTKAEIDKVKAQATARLKRKDGPWFEYYEAMGLKTIVKRLCKWLPSSWQLQTAVTLDDKAEAGVEQTIDLIDVAATSTPSDLDTTKSNAEIRKQLSKPAEEDTPAGTGVVDAIPMEVDAQPADDPIADEPPPSKVRTNKQEALSRCRRFYVQLDTEVRQQVLADFGVASPLAMRDIDDADLLDKIGNALSDSLKVQGGAK